MSNGYFSNVQMPIGHVLLSCYVIALCLLMTSSGIQFFYRYLSLVKGINKSSIQYSFLLLTDAGVIAVLIGLMTFSNDALLLPGHDQLMGTSILWSVIQDGTGDNTPVRLIYRGDTVWLSVS
jgi:hypothetical protein